MNHGQYGRMARAGSFRGPYRRSLRMRFAQWRRRNAFALAWFGLILLIIGALVLIGR
jgi:hypothetical protein